MSDPYELQAEVREMHAALAALRQENDRLTSKLKGSTTMPDTCGSISGSISNRWPHHWHATYLCPEHKVVARASGKSWRGRKAATAAYSRAMSQIFRVGADHQTTLASSRRIAERGA